MARRAYSFWLTTFSLNVASLLCFFDVNELNNIQYGIEILDKPLILGDDDVVLSSIYGQLYRCTYSSALQAEKSKWNMQDDSSENQLGVAELLKPLELSTCLVHTVHWWSYELCFKKEVKQYHLEGGKITGDILSLGHYASEFDWNGDNVELSPEAKERYHSQTYKNGTVCDLTGDMRETTVQFRCDSKATEDYIWYVEEPSSCKYLITVHTVRLCTHQLLRTQATKPTVPIICQPTLSASEMQRYSALHMPSKEADTGKVKKSVRISSWSGADMVADVELTDVNNEEDQSNDASATSANENDPKKEGISGEVDDGDTVEMSFGGISVRIKVNHSPEPVNDITVDDVPDHSSDTTKNVPDLEQDDPGAPPERMEVRILNAAYYDSDGKPVGKYPQDSSTTLDKAVMAVVVSNDNEIAEYTSHKKLQKNYRFKWTPAASTDDDVDAGAADTTDENEDHVQH